VNVLILKRYVLQRKHWNPPAKKGKRRQGGLSPRSREAGDINFFPARHDEGRNRAWHEGAVEPKKENNNDI
jgi:hypothetical protein